MLSDVFFDTFITGGSTPVADSSDGISTVEIGPVVAIFEAANFAKSDTAEISFERSVMLPLVLISIPPLRRVISTWRFDLGDLGPCDLAKVIGGLNSSSGIGGIRLVDGASQEGAVYYGTAITTENIIIEFSGMYQPCCVGSDARHGCRILF